MNRGKRNAVNATLELFVIFALTAALLIAHCQLVTNRVRLQWRQAPGTNPEAVAVGWIVLHGTNRLDADMRLDASEANAELELVRPVGRLEYFWVVATNAEGLQSARALASWPPPEVTNVRVTGGPLIEAAGDLGGPWGAVSSNGVLNVPPTSPAAFFRGSNLSVELQGGRVR